VQANPLFFAFLLPMVTDGMVTLECKAHHTCKAIVMSTNKIQKACRSIRCCHVPPRLAGHME
jgi:hypothetical protein